MKFFGKEKIDLLKSKNKKMLTVFVASAVIAAAVCALSVIFRATIGRTGAQIVCTFLTAGIVCAAIVVFKIRAQNERMIALFTSVQSDGEIVCGVFLKDAGIITKKGIPFRQIYLSISGVERRFLAYGASSAERLEEGKTVTFKVVGEVITERL